ncbi:UNVERIFIED_CONTAM: hypothetical protein FKN15_015479 [Acipenser sinensis]
MSKYSCKPVKGKAPIPTLVVYALTTPYTSPTFWGGIPRPVQTPPTVQLDEVTKGNYYIMFMVFITFINLIAIPMELAFLEGEHTEGFNMMIFNLCSDTLFLLDIAINFRMGVITEDSEVVLLDPKLIACHYLKSWFVLDLISAFPVDYVILIVKELEEDQNTTTYTASKLVRIVLFARIFSLIRLLRVSRLVRFFSEWEQVANSNMEAVRLFIRIICLFAMILLLCHWNGCIQYFIPSLQDFPEDCWVVRENLTHAPWIEKYSFGVFRALSHMIGVGYGSADPPTGEAELWVVMTSMVSGALMYTMMVANVAAMMTNVDAASKAYRSKFNHLEDYMSYRKLPKNLRSRISTYYQARYQGKWFDEREILNVLSESLKVEILGNLCADLVKTVPMFQGRDINFINAVLLKLQCEVFQEGDIIIREKAAGDRMFFIEHGRVMVKTEQNFCTELADGDYFGEICLLTKCRRTASVQALTLCNLFSLSAEKFNEVLQEFPEIKEEMLRTASQRLWTLQAITLLSKSKITCDYPDVSGKNFYKYFKRLQEARLEVLKKLLKQREDKQQEANTKCLDNQGLLELEASLPDFVTQPRIKAPKPKTNTGFIKRAARRELELSEIHQPINRNTNHQLQVNQTSPDQVASLQESQEASSRQLSDAEPHQDPSGSANKASSQIYSMLPHIADLSTYMIQQIINFAKILSSFRELSIEDQIALLKGATFEVCQIRFNMLFNTESGIWKCGPILYNIDDAANESYSFSLQPINRNTNHQLQVNQTSPDQVASLQESQEASSRQLSDAEPHQDPSGSANKASSQIYSMLPHIADLSTYMIQQIINFAKILSSFRELSIEDQIALLKGATFEVCQIRFNMLFNTESGIWKCGPILYNIDDAANGSGTRWQVLLQGQIDCWLFFLNSAPVPIKIMACLTELRTMNDEYTKQVLKIQDIQPDVTPLMMEVFSNNP